MLLESFKSIIGWVAFAVSQPFFIVMSAVMGWAMMPLTERNGRLLSIFLCKCELWVQKKVRGEYNFSHALALYSYIRMKKRKI